MFLDFLGLQGPLNEQVKQFYRKWKDDSEWIEESFMDFIRFQLDRVKRAEITEFPATVPSIFLLTYLQAQHIDLEFYDHYFKHGAYLSTHKNHMSKWHDNWSRK
jgi:hypothetical protein